jgi:adenylate cyclase
MTEKLKRRLTTVLCADVQGYSPLTEADELGALATLRLYRTAMASMIERHDGRIINTWGDAVISKHQAACPLSGSPFLASCRKQPHGQ